MPFEQADPNWAEIDRAGIDHVLDYETRQGRRPTEMPHDNPGYDIESDLNDELERVIEVKSKRGSWLQRDVGLTARQMEEARQRGPQYWLYVVEHALDESVRVNRIQDPAGKVTHYMFDDGWAEFVAESDGIVDDHVSRHYRRGGSAPDEGLSCLPVFASKEDAGDHLAMVDIACVGWLVDQAGALAPQLVGIEHDDGARVVILDPWFGVDTVGLHVLGRVGDDWVLGTQDPEMQRDAVTIRPNDGGVLTPAIDDFEVFAVVRGEWSESNG